MEPNQIEEFLAKLEPYAEGWKAGLPDPFTFLGEPITLVIQTVPIPRDEVRRPNEAEFALAKKVLSALPEIIRLSEAGFKEYHADYPEYFEDADNVEVWINEEALELDGPERWTFVINSKQNAFYGTHVVFDGVEYLETWGGD